MKRSFMYLAAAFSLAVFVSCASSSVYKETAPAESLNKYTVIHVNNLTLDKSVWKDVGLKSEEEWAAVASGANSEFQKSLRENLPGKTVSFAEAGAKLPAKAELEITLSEGKIGRGYMFAIGPWGAIETTVTIKNVKSNTVVYQAVIEARKTNTFSLNDQMQGSAKKVAENIAGVLNK